MEEPMAAVNLNVNGKVHRVEAEPETPLLWVLRDELGLTGSKYGCGVGVCGACTVLVDGEPERSCVRTVREVTGKKIVTIEGLSATGQHPVQRAWMELDVPQCGYCQAGQILTAVALLKAKPKPTDRDIDESMGDLVCRCGTYDRIRKAIHRAAQIGGQK
jgi:aerobic-type carbon monoxide dehydrogenase small subunit (CoxS/CutS family)